MARYRRILSLVPVGLIGLIVSAVFLLWAWNSGPRLSVEGLGASVVSEGGPIVGGLTNQNHNEVDVLAAVSEPDLCGLALALGDSSGDIAGSGDGCWGITLPRNSLFVAVEAAVPCASTHLTIGLRGDRLVLGVSTRSVYCPPGSGMAARPRFSLLAVPLRNLPAKVLTIDPGGATSVVDLRPPLQVEDVQTRFRGARLAIEEASADATTWSPQPVTELSIMSWTDPGLGCLPGKPPDGIRRRGYEVMLGGLTYRWAPGLLVFCGPGTLSQLPSARPIVDPNLFFYRDLVAADSIKLGSAWLRGVLPVVQHTATTPVPGALLTAARQFSNDLSGLEVPGPLAESDRRLNAALRTLESDLDTIASSPGSSLTSEVWVYDPTVTDYVGGSAYNEVRQAEATVSTAASASIR
jgi:hypothetical protein